MGQQFNVKRWMAKVTQSLIPSCVQIALPYTTPKAGIFLCALRVQQTGRGYVVLNNTLPNIIDGYQTSGGYVCATLFAPKGVTVSIAENSNLRNLVMYFVSLG